MTFIVSMVVFALLCVAGGFMVRHTVRHDLSSTAEDEVDRTMARTGMDQNAFALLRAKYPRSRRLCVAWVRSVEGKREEWEPRVEQMYREHPNFDHAALMWGNVLSDRGDYPAAEKVLKRARDSRHTKDARMWLHLAMGRLAHRQKNLPAAMERLDRAIALYPGNPYPYIHKAEVLQAEGDQAGALQALLAGRAAPRDNKGELAWDHLGGMIAQRFQQDGRWAEAADAWAACRVANDLAPGNYIEGARACLRAGRDAEAARLIETAEMLFARDEAVMEQLRALRA